MILQNAIASTDSLVPNTFDITEKQRWLKDFDHSIYNNLISQYQGSPEVEFNSYGPETELLIEDPYSDVYVLYLEAQIYRYLGEIGRYNNAILSVESKLDEYRKHYNRTHEDFNIKFRCFTPYEREQKLPPELRR